MKILQYIIGIVLFAGLFVACEDDEYQPKSSYSDVGYYSSYETSKVKVAGVGAWEAFMDVSQGAIYHSWSIDSGNYFVEGNISNSEKEFEKYIVNPGDTLSTETTVGVLFQEGDTASVVRLFNVFEDSVAFRTVNDDDEQIAVSAVYQEDGEWAGKWVFDYSILVDVYDTIVTDMVIRRDGAVIDHTVEGAEIELMVGDVLEFEDLSAEVDNTARPDETTWKIQTIEENEDDIETIVSSSKQLAEITFKKMGVFNGVLISKRAGGDKIPGDTEEYMMPITFKVIQSDQPFIQDGAIKELEDESIQIPFNAEFQAGFTDPKAHFSVKVNDVDFPVQSVTLHENNTSILVLKLVDAIYASDVITVSYDGLSTALMSSDERNPEAFTDVNVKNFDPNMLQEAGGFEDTLGETWKTTAGATNNPVEYSTEQVASGNSSLKVSVAIPDGAAANSIRGRFESSGKLLVLEAAKTYTVKFKRYVVSAGLDMGSNAEKLYLKAPGASVQINKPAITDQSYQTWDATKFDSWEEVEFDINLTADMTGAYFYMQVNPGSFTVYYDDFYIAEKEGRD